MKTLRLGSIALLSPGELFGGVETQVLSLCAGLKIAGVEVLPILFHDRELASRLRLAGIPPKILSVPHRYDPVAAGRLARHLRRHGCGLLHVHGYRATVTAGVAGNALRAAVVKTEHGLPEPATRPVDRIKSRLNRSLDDWATRRLRAHVRYVTADIMRRFDQAHAGLDRSVIHNGIEPITREGRARPIELEPGCFQMAIIGRLSPVKGIHFALRAMAFEAVPATVRLNIIGFGTEGDSLRREAESIGLGAKVTFYGFRRDALDWLAHMDALLMPSLHEGLPYTLLEAMSLGVPVVGSRVGGIMEVLRHEDTGLLVDVGDVGGLAREVGRLARDPELGCRLGAAAALEQRERYTLSRVVRDYLQTYALAVAAA